MSRVCSIIVSLVVLLSAAEAKAWWIFGDDDDAQGNGKYMVTSAHPLASEAGRDVLAAGGSAVDAAIAVQMVLTLAEPQSSGIGGGAFMLYYDADDEDIEVYDGRETAPAAATPELFLDESGKPLGFIEAAKSGRSVGVPGVMRMLERAHREHGKLPWERLFEAAIGHAEEGFQVTPRFNYIIDFTPALPNNPRARALFFGPDGKALPVGAVFKNPALAQTFRTLASEGAEAFYNGPIAESIVNTVRTAPDRPGQMTLEDLAGYEPKMRDVICRDYREWKLCGMPPPSSGGVTVMQILGLLERFDLPSMEPQSLEAVHLIAEAMRLAYADRAMYLADSDFVTVPVKGLIDDDYLARRSTLIRPDARIHQPTAGRPAGFRADWAPQTSRAVPSTSHFSIVDGDGNAVSMTTTVEFVFGSNLIAGGFILNNQLTDFSREPRREGKLVANAPAGGKRPLSSMSPTFVFDEDDELVLVMGSPGGPRIIAYVAKALIGVLDWGLDVQTAIALPNQTIGRSGNIDLEADTALVELRSGLEALGHKVDVKRLTSGLHGISLLNGELSGGADPRREGIVLGN